MTFVLQKSSWVTHKERHKVKSYYLYLHVLIHGVLAYALVFDLYFWDEALILAGLHLLIDLAKVYFQREKRKRTWFFIDQLLHLASIAGLWYIITQPGVYWQVVFNESYWLIACAALFLTTPSSMVMHMLMGKWQKHLPSEETHQESLTNAGKYIGIIERLFILLFILINEWQAVGFLITAKSIFRFGDLTRAKDRKLTEYVLIGTLISFGIAMVTGLVVQSLC